MGSGFVWKIGYPNIWWCIIIILPLKTVINCWYTDILYTNFQVDTSIVSSESYLPFSPHSTPMIPLCLVETSMIKQQKEWLCLNIWYPKNPLIYHEFAYENGHISHFQTNIVFLSVGWYITLCVCVCVILMCTYKLYIYIYSKNVPWYPHIRWFPFFGNPPFGPASARDRSTALAPNWSLRRTSLSAVPSRGPSHRRTSWRRPFFGDAAGRKNGRFWHRELEPEKVAYKML